MRRPPAPTATNPGYAATISCTSRITYVDGEKGVLMYRGYAADELARNSNFEEVCWLLLHGELPKPDELKAFSNQLKTLRACASGSAGRYRRHAPPMPIP